VVLAASGDSISSAPIYSIYPRSLRTADDLREKLPYDLMHASLSLKQASEFDVVHNHAGDLVMAMSHLVDTPMLSTMHCLITPDSKFVWDQYEGWYNTISYSEKRLMPPVANRNFAGVVYNAIDVESFPFKEEKDSYLLFLSRISADKAPHLAIEVARRVGQKIIIAGKVDPNPVDQQYFRDEVMPLVDNKTVFFFGEANAKTKRELYAQARCLLIPLRWDEPFGLVLAEAMACGTPVVAFRRGAAPELIVDGETGFLVDDVDGMVDAVKRIKDISPLRCRSHVRKNFGPEQMAEGYLEIYADIAQRALPGRIIPALTPVGQPQGALPAARDAAVA
jgi:glycosyltransferase involved in cell wall biosynthesis